MLDDIETEQIDDAIDRFEDTWSPEAQFTIHELLAEYGLSGDREAIVELVRIDIELRYKHDLSVELDSYLEDFPCLKHAHEHVGRIAFEDFRARQRLDHPIQASRWKSLPGIRNEVWFQRLLVESSNGQLESRLGPFQPSLDSGIDLAFESALADEGFRLVQEIGQGALGRVYLATQNELADRYVVLKVVSQPMSEPQNMALLQHTNIVPIYSFLQVLSRSVICMPYAGRLTLADYLASTSDPSQRVGESMISTVRARIDSTKIAPLSSPADGIAGAAVTRLPTTPAADERAVSKPLEELRKLDCNHLATWIFQRLSAALAHAHARGLQHNDLKPGNVLIRNDGEPALLDFNLSQSIGRTSPRQAGGTLPYMSPETYRTLMGQKHTPQASSDIYSMGVMLFQFVTGRLPYPSPDSMAPIDLDAAIEHRKQPPLWSHDDRVSPGLKTIIDRCLAYAPADRYQGGDELHNDLNCEHKSLPLVHTRESRVRQAKKWFRRHPATTSAGSVATILGVCLIPLIFASVSWLNQSQHLEAVAAFDSFAADSEQTIALLLADNRRATEPFIRRGMSTLEEHGILDSRKFETRVYDAMLPDEQQSVDETVLRHVVPLGLLEVQRLTQETSIQDLQADDLRRLDRLIVSADRLDGDSPSRALLFLKSSRAKLDGDMNRHQNLATEALAMEPESDSEQFLESIRLLFRSNYPAAAGILTALADRKSIPSGLRWIALGRSQFNSERYEDALISHTQAVHRYPKLAALRRLRGNCYLKQRLGARQEADFTRAIELDPEHFAGWINRGSLRLGRRQLDDSIADLTQALVISPGHVQALLMRSRAYRLAERHEESAQDLSEAMTSQNADVSSLRSRAIARKETDPEGALEDLRRADLMEPNSPVTLSRMGRLLSDDLGRNDEGVFLLARVVEIQPHDERSLVDYAVLLARAGRHADAREHINQAMKSARNNRSYYQAACVCALNPDRQSQIDALSFLAKAVRAGYDTNRLGSDPDLASIRAMPGFAAISRVYQLAKLSKRKTP